MRKHKKRCRYRVLAVILFAWTQNTACSGPAAPTCGGQGCPPCKLYCVWPDTNPNDDVSGWDMFYIKTLYVPGKGWSCCGWEHPPCDDVGFNHWYEIAVAGCEGKNLPEPERSLKEQFCIIASYYDEGGCFFAPSMCNGHCFYEEKILNDSEFEEYFERCILPKCEKYVEPDLL